MHTNLDFLINAESQNAPIDKAINKSNIHPSILTIQNFAQNSDCSFSFLCDLFLSEYSSEFTIFPDDTNPYKCGKSYDEIIKKTRNNNKKSIFIITI